jgi:hypothetical protein
MTSRISVTEALGTIIHDVAENRICLSDVMETIKTWETDMDARAVAITHATIATKFDPMALRARGMHLAVLSLAVRLEALMRRSASVDARANHPSVTA